MDEETQGYNDLTWNHIFGDFFFLFFPPPERLSPLSWSATSLQNTLCLKQQRAEKWILPSWLQLPRVDPKVQSRSGSLLFHMWRFYGRVSEQGFPFIFYSWKFILQRIYSYSQTSQYPRQREEISNWKHTSLLSLQEDGNSLTPRNQAESMVWCTFLSYCTVHCRLWKRDKFCCD